MQFGVTFNTNTREVTETSDKWYCFARQDRWNDVQYSRRLFSLPNKVLNELDETPLQPKCETHSPLHFYICIFGYSSVLAQAHLQSVGGLIWANL